MDFFQYSKKSLIAFGESPLDSWTVDDAMKGTSIIGGTGSGKTSGSGRQIALKFLKEGWGGLVLCAKSDEAKQWEEYCDEAGRSDDYIRFGKGCIHKSGAFQGQQIVFNPIDYELTREGDGAGETQNVTNIFMNIHRMGNRIANEGDTKDERFWDVALKRCLNRTVELIKLAGEPLTYRNMVYVLRSCDRFDKKQLADATKDAIKGNLNNYSGKDVYCMYCLIKTYLNILNEPSSSENNIAFEMSLEYFLTTFRTMGEKTKATISEMFMGLAEPFLSGLLFRHFSGVTNFFPEQIYGYNRFNKDDKRKIVLVLDFGIKEYLDAGIIAQCVFKLMFQQAVERRNVENFPTPVFLWCDEAQYFLNPYDQIFLTTARSSRTATVYLSQNISNYLAVMGAEKDGKARVDSLMGNLSTKIFHANSDAETNEYASRLIGDAVKLLTGTEESHPHFSMEKTESTSTRGEYMAQVRPKDFTVLKTGGMINNFKVQAVIAVAGRKWANNKNYIRKTFTQKFRNYEQ